MQSAKLMAERNYSGRGWATALLVGDGIAGDGIAVAHPVRNHVCITREVGESRPLAAGPTR